MSDRNCICKLLSPIYSRWIEYLSDKEKMSLTHLKLDLNENFGTIYPDYNTAANECVTFFEGAYEYGCPGKRSTVLIVLHSQAIDNGSLQVNFDHDLNSPRWGIVWRFCRMFGVSKWSAKCQEEYCRQSGRTIVGIRPNQCQLQSISTLYWNKCLYD